MLAIYVRKSRERKKEKSIKEQKLLGQEFAIENNIDFEFYDDGIISGQKGKAERKRFSELLKDIESNKITGVYIWDSSRLARNEIAWHTFADLLRDKGTLLYDNGVPADFRDENTYLFYTIKAGMDAHFARVTAKKIKTVLKRNATEGIPHGLLPYGYIKSENDKWQIDENEAEVIKSIFDLYEKGYGYIRIAKHLNEMGIDTRYNIEWTPATIRYMIYNTTYSGRAKYNDLEIKVPSIIDKKRQQKIIASIGSRYKKPGPKSKKYLLNEISFCKKCGTRYTISQRTRHTHYRCLSEVNRGVPKCFSRAVRAELLDKLIFENVLLGRDLYEHAKSSYMEGGNVEQRNELEKKLKYHSKRYDALKQELKRSYQGYVRGNTPLEFYLDEKKRIDRQMLKTEDNIREFEDNIQKINDTNRVLDEIEVDFKLPNVWEDEKDPIKKAWMEHSIQEAISANRIESNREQIVENMPIEEKIALVEKYIKRIEILHFKSPLLISIEFTIPIPAMELLVESRYYGAKNLTTGKIHILRDFGTRPKLVYKRMLLEFKAFRKPITIR
ncbi:MAG: recombinase family protein [Flavobacteriaceae bacterium]|nr:recombinase family protein [Flavobacteriaceae bacterium]